MDAVSLRVAAKDDMQTIWKMQIEAFSDLLHKYQDYWDDIYQYKQ